MADNGLLIHNNNNEILIDSKYRNISVISEGATAFNDSGELFPPGFPKETIVPLLLMKVSDSFYIQAYQFDGSSLNWVYGFMVSVIPGGILKWSYCDIDASPPNSNYGLLVKNQSGVTVFDSTKNYFKMVASHSITFASLSSFTFTPVDAINNFFMVIGSSPIDVSQYDAAIYDVGIIRIGSSIKAEYVSMQQYKNGDIASVTAGNDPNMAGTSYPSFSGSVLELSTVY